MELQTKMCAAGVFKIKWKSKDSNPLENLGILLKVGYLKIKGYAH
jgi:hypothetical protein